MQKNQESRKDCHHEELPSQKGLKTESTQNYDEMDKPDLSVLKQSGRMNSLTHFVAPWSRFGEPLIREFPSSET